MAKPKVLVPFGLGIGCHEEVKDAYEQAGADARIIHINDLIRGNVVLSDYKIINLAGGFDHGDILGSGMCEANRFEMTRVKTSDGEKKLKDLLIEFAERGNVIYGQCNGYQMLVKLGLLPGVNNDYSRQTVTLTDNDVGVYQVWSVRHAIEEPAHFAFAGIDSFEIDLWCRHGEGKLLFRTRHGLVEHDEAERVRTCVNENHVLLRYINPRTSKPTQKFPYNPNGSENAIAGLRNESGNIFGHMAHTEGSTRLSRHPDFFKIKDNLRRQGMRYHSLNEENMTGIGYEIFKNVVRHVNES